MGDYGFDIQRTINWMRPSMGVVFSDYALKYTGYDSYQQWYSERDYIRNFRSWLGE